jgi:hypothetical protein
MPRKLADTVEDFRSIGRHIARRPQPPWATGSEGFYPSFFRADNNNNNAERSERPEFSDRMVHLGSFATLFIMAERTINEDAQNLTPRLLGPLAAAYPYIARRWKLDHQAILPDLPVPKRFQTIFKDWANGKVDFTAK